MPVLILILNGIFALATVFIACEIGHRMSEAFEEMIDFTIDQWDWYRLPREIRLVLPMIMLNAQQPITLECFGSIKCSREVFKNVSTLVEKCGDWSGWLYLNSVAAAFHIRKLLKLMFFLGHSSLLFIFYGATPTLLNRIWIFGHPLPFIEFLWHV